MFCCANIQYCLLLKSNYNTNLVCDFIQNLLFCENCFKPATYMGNFTSMEQKKNHKSNFYIFFSCTALNSHTISFYMRK